MELTNEELLSINGGKIKIHTLIEAAYTVYELVKFIIKKAKR